MDNHFVVDILTPEKVVTQKTPAASLLIPTVSGQINILPNHTHLIAELATGELSLFGGADDPDCHFSVTHGICKVLKDQVVILAMTSEENREIDHDRAVKALQNAEDILASRDNLTDKEMMKYRRKVERAKLRIQMAKRHRST